MEGDNGGGKGKGFSGTCIKDKGHMDKTKGEQDQGWEVGMAGVGRGMGGEWRHLYLTNNKKKKKRKK